MVRLGSGDDEAQGEVKCEKCDETMGVLEIEFVGFKRRS